MSENVVLHPDSLSMKVIPMKLCVNGCHEFNAKRTWKWCFKMFGINLDSVG